MISLFPGCFFFNSSSAKVEWYLSEELQVKVSGNGYSIIGIKMTINVDVFNFRDNKNHFTGYAVWSPIHFLSDKYVILKYFWTDFDQHYCSLLWVHWKNLFPPLILISVEFRCIVGWAGNEVVNLSKKCLLVENFTYSSLKKWAVL